MAKTYNSIPTVSTGDVYTATAHNNIVTNVNNYRVPPMVRAVRSSDLTGYTSGAPITWQSATANDGFDTDSMWDSGDPTKITVNTSGVYLVNLTARFQASATLTHVNVGCAVNASTSTTTSVVQGTQPESGTLAWVNLSVVLPLDATDYLTFGIFPSGGSNYLIKGYTAIRNDQSAVSLTWLGQAS